MGAKLLALFQANTEMRVIALIAMLLVSTLVGSDGVEGLLQRGTRAYCRWTAMVMLQGADARRKGLPPILLSPREKGKRGMVIEDYDDLSERDRAVFLQYVRLGWWAQDAELRNKKEGLRDKILIKVLAECFKLQRVGI